MQSKRNRIDDYLDDEFEFDEEFSREHRKSRKANYRQSHRQRKKRIYDYEEHLWTKRNGLYLDEVYTDLTERP